ncbi:hypothetical protein COMNV_00440 [Commensalibacter sp. Nvir]|uniref:hypothetical protein n=1 Tax=Commensalibacter sp. Nvir TaxID=3069817 RepID=UPI002D6801F5|nr:hypothetical protein COMNV_00440 [Commensalibacter sp. Nvir]
MASVTNYLMNLLKKNNSFSITDQQGNSLVTELKIISVSITEEAISSRQPINLTQNAIRQKTRTTVTEADLNHAREITVTSTKINHDDDILYTKVIHPASLRISCLSSSVTTNLQLVQLFKNCETLYTITSRTVKLKNMTVTGLEFNIDPEHLNVYPVQIDLKEVFSPDKTYSPLKDGDQDATSLTITPHSVLNKVEDLAKSMVKKLG